MALHRPPSGSRAVLFALGLTALVSGTVGAGMWYASAQAQREAALVEGLREQGAGELRGLGAGQAVLVAGTLAPKNAARLRTLVAYLHYEPHRERSGNTTRTKWRVRQRVTPPLWVETATGPVLIRNETYELGAATKEPGDLGERGPTSWQDEGGGRVWDPSVPASGPQWYTGFEAGQAVVVLGTVARGGASPELEASRVFGGTREQLLASARGSARLFQMLAWVLLPLSLVTLLALGWRLARRSRA